MRRALVICLLPSMAFAQGQPEDEWKSLPNTPVPTAPPPTPTPVAPRNPPLAVPPAQRLYAPRLRPREQPNSVSMFGAPSLGQWKRGQAFVLGFPFLQVRAALGVSEALDIGVAYNSYFLFSHEVRLLVKYGFGKGDGVSFALAFEGGGAFFNQRASKETRGARWITGSRNFNFSPGAIISYQAASLRAPRLFAEVRYMLTVDTEPFATTPLQGVPARFILGHNVLTRLGAELPLSERTSLLLSLGLDGHLRPDDSPVMPSASVGLITGF
jgi:hypothetical protein